MGATETTESTEPESPYRRVRDVAKYFNCGLSTVYELIESGELRAVSVGKGGSGYRVHKDDIRAYECRRRTGGSASEPLPA